jgi:hypothetical protein
LRENGFDPTTLREYNITGWDNALRPLKADMNAEKGALEVLFHSLGGDYWHSKAGWNEMIEFDLNSPINSGSTIGSGTGGLAGFDSQRGVLSKQMNTQTMLSRVFGLTCNGSLQVTKLTLPNNNLKGNIVVQCKSFCYSHYWLSQVPFQRHSAR